MTLLQAIIFYSVDFIIMIGVVVCAVLLGKKLRDSKDAKKIEDTQN